MIYMFKSDIFWKKICLNLSDCNITGTSDTSSITTASLPVNTSTEKSTSSMPTPSSTVSKRSDGTSFHSSPMTVPPTQSSQPSSSVTQSTAARSSVTPTGTTETKETYVTPNDVTSSTIPSTSKSLTSSASVPSTNSIIPSKSSTPSTNQAESSTLSTVFSTTLARKIPTSTLGKSESDKTEAPNSTEEEIIALVIAVTIFVFAIIATAVFMIKKWIERLVLMI